MKSKRVYKYPNNRFPSFLPLALLESIKNRLKIGLKEHFVTWWKSSSVYNSLKKEYETPDDIQFDHEYW